MEILTYVVEGQLRHRDSMGEQHTLGANELQLMSVAVGSLTANLMARKPSSFVFCKSGFCLLRKTQALVSTGRLHACGQTGALVLLPDRKTTTGRSRSSTGRAYMRRILCPMARFAMPLDRNVMRGCRLSGEAFR